MPRNEETLTARLRTAGFRTGARDVDRVGAAASRVDKHARRATGSLRLFSSGLRPVVRLGIGAAGALGVYGLAGAFRHIYDAGRDALKTERQTNAVIKSTGGVAGVSADHVDKLANTLSLRAGIDDDAIKQGENLLLTFRRVHNEQGRGNKIFDRSTKTILDMSVALRQSLRSSALQLGRALGDPIRGVTALRRVGVQLTDSQRRLIEHFVRTGHIMKAQKVILRELRSEFGGSAAAQAESMDKLRVVEHRLAEEAGKYLVPLVNRAADALLKFVEQVEHNTGAGGKFRHVVVGIVHVFHDLFLWGKKNKIMLAELTGAVLAGYAAWKTYLIISKVLGVVKIAIVLWRAWQAGTLALTAAQLGLDAALLANPIGAVIVALVALGAAFIVAYNKVRWFRHGVQAVWGWIKGHWPLLAEIMLGPFGGLAALVIKNFSKVRGIVINFLNWFIRRYNNLQGIPGLGSLIPGGPINEIATFGPGNAHGGEHIHTTHRQRRTIRDLLSVPGPLGHLSATPDIHLNSSTTLTLRGAPLARETHRQSLKRRATR